MKAIIETGGKQYLVEEKSVIYVEKLDAENEKESEVNCIGFQAPTITDNEEEDNED